MGLLRMQPNMYKPTVARTGSNSPTILRGKNLFIRGEGDNTYAEVYGGSDDLSEDLPAAALTGTVAMTSGSKDIVGTGTSFRTELHPSQRLITSNNKHIVVDEIFSDTLFEAVALQDATASGLTARRLRNLFEIGKDRGSLESGRVIQADTGALIGVGDGDLYKNGSLLPGDSFTASKRASIALQDENGDYTFQQLGFTIPVGITAAAVTPLAAAFTFANTDINTTTDTVNEVAHGLITGSQIALSSSGTMLSIDGAVVPASRKFYVIRVDADNFQLTDTLADAVGGTELDITAQGTGTFTATPILKVMPAGDRSIRISKASTKLGTPSYGNPGPKITVTLTAGQAIQVNFPAMDSNGNPNDPHDAWRVEGTAHGGTTTAATANAESGPWYWVRTISSEEVNPAGGTFVVDYLDAEIESSPRLVTFDNDPPVDAEDIASVAGYPVLVSCQGKPNPVYPDGTSPGPSIVPFKPNNISAAPLVLDTGVRNEVPLSPPEVIVGCYMAAGRLYLMTPNTLQIASFTQDPDFPVTTRPFWKSGFRNPYAVCFVNGRLYGYTTAGAIRSVADGEEGSEEHRFAADVEEIMRLWRPENVMVIHDPKNECICYVHTGGSVNSDGFFITEIVPFMLRSESWSTPVVVSSSTEDRIVSGVATVNGRFEFVAGGRLSGGTWGSKTFRFDEPNGESVPWSLAWQYTDAGSEDRPKKVKFPRVTGKVTAASIGIYGPLEDEEILVDELMDGNAGSLTGAVALDNSTGVVYRASEDCAVSGLMAFTMNIEGTWDGTGDRDRVDEAKLEVLVQGGRK